MKNNSYEDIINLSHPVSKNHPQMPLRDRAAQFAPFAALTGHDAAIKETARLTDERLELSEEVIAQAYSDKVKSDLEVPAKRHMKSVEVPTGEKSIDRKSVV